MLKRKQPQSKCTVSVIIDRMIEKVCVGDTKKMALERIGRPDWILFDPSGNEVSDCHVITHTDRYYRARDSKNYNHNITD
jgi:hypothetical protein